MGSEIRQYALVRLKDGVSYRLSHCTLAAGAVGTVVDIYTDAKTDKSGVEVEFTDDEGRTLAVVTVLGDDLEPIETPAEGS